MAHNQSQTMYRPETPMTLLSKASDMQAPTLPVRMCVGILLFNRDGLVWVGRRRPKWVADHSSFIWQMPQGGIEPYESPRDAALRELREETGIISVEVVAEMPEWLTYELPESLVGIALKGRYRGQRQKWFAMRFTGDDSEVNIGPKAGLKAEFETWRWAPLALVPKLIIPFKRDLYDRVTSEFAPHVVPVDAV